MSLKKKAQASSELIIVIAIVLILSVAVLGYFNSIKNPTIAMGLAKTNTLDALAKSEKSFTIREIIFSEPGGNPTLDITTSPVTVGCRPPNDDINAKGTKDMIISKGLYADIAINLNGNPC